MFRVKPVYITILLQSYMRLSSSDRVEQCEMRVQIFRMQLKPSIYVLVQFHAEGGIVLECVNQPGSEIFGAVFFVAEGGGEGGGAFYSADKSICNQRVRVSPKLNITSYRFVICTESVIYRASFSRPPPYVTKIQP